MENKDRFTKKAEIYDKYRPRYSMEFIDYLYSSEGFSSSSKVADIGAGTGLLSEEFLKKGSSTILVELNDNMLKEAQKKLMNYRNASFIHGSAENTTIDDYSIDFITVGQAFHWFDIYNFKNECIRILKENGKVVIVWNVTDSSDEVNIAVSNLNSMLCERYSNFSSRDKEDSSSYLNFFNEFSSFVFNNDLYLNKEDFIGRNLTRSYTPNFGDDNYEEYIKGLDKIFNEYSNKGKIKIKNNTKGYIGRV